MGLQINLIRLIGVYEKARNELADDYNIPEQQTSEIYILYEILGSDGGEALDLGLGL
jgi:hypothetical protein